MLEKHGEAFGRFLEVMIVELEVGLSQEGGNGVSKHHEIDEVILCF